MRILIAEDNAVNLKLLRVMLNAEGLETLEATDGVQALALLREHRVDAIISDILMPNMDGYRLCHEVRRSPEWHHLPFIFYTSTYDSGEDEKVALDMGADRFLRKPQPVRVIVQALQEIVSAGPRAFEPIGPAHEAELMKEYSERLVYKLEEQIAELRERSAQLAAEVTERKRAERRAEESLALTQRSGQALLRRIEEQEQAELALRESEQNLRLALDAAQMGTFDWDIPGNRLKWSRWHEQMWGFQRGEFPGSFEAFSSRVHPEDLSLLKTRIDACGITREPFQMEFRLVWPDGSVHWIQSRGEFAYDAEGKPSRMRGVVVETTAQKQVMEALRDSEERHRLLADNASDVIWIMNLEGKLTYISPSVEKLRGYTPAEAMAQTVEQTLAPDSAARGAVLFRSALAELAAGRPFPESRSEVEHLCKDGSTVWTEVTTSPIVGTDGKLIGILGVIRDVSERRRLIAALDEERVRLLEAQAVARVGSWQTEFPSHAVIWSDQTHRIFETEPTTFTGTQHEFMRRVHPADRERVEAAFKASAESTSPCSIEHRIVVEGGGVKHVEERWQVFFDAHGAPLRAVGTCRDITAEVQTQEKMAAQLDELRRWQATMLGREARNQELKREVNELCRKLGEPIRYPSQDMPPL
jgi:PAS domain S-box-containing protein